jgi:ABC-type antimicrobial peptide transport system permease subunit
MRRALGASRWQLARQLLLESGSIGLLGAALGSAIAFLGVPALLALAPPSLGLPLRIPLDLRILAATGLFGLLAGMICGVGPSLLVGRAASGLVLTLRALGSEPSGSGSVSRSACRRSRYRD